MDNAREKLAELEEQLAVLKESQLATASPQWLKDKSSDA
jgi:hypothetical protein